MQNILFIKISSSSDISEESKEENCENMSILTGVEPAKWHD